MSRSRALLVLCALLQLQPVVGVVGLVGDPEALKRPATFLQRGPRAGLGGGLEDLPTTMFPPPSKGDFENLPSTGEGTARRKQSLLAAKRRQHEDYELLNRDLPNRDLPEQEQQGPAGATGGAPADVSGARASSRFMQLSIDEATPSSSNNPFRKLFRGDPRLKNSGEQSFLARGGGLMCNYGDGKPPRPCPPGFRPPGGGGPAPGSGFGGLPQTGQNGQQVGLGMSGLPNIGDIPIGQSACAPCRDPAQVAKGMKCNCPLGSMCVPDGNSPG